MKNVIWAADIVYVYAIKSSSHLMMKERRMVTSVKYHTLDKVFVTP